MKPLTNYTQSDRVVHLSQVFGPRLQTLGIADQLTLLCILSLTLRRHTEHDRTYTLTNAANDQPYAPSRSVLRAVSILHEATDGEIAGVIQAIAEQINTSAPVGGNAA